MQVDPLTKFVPKQNLSPNRIETKLEQNWNRIEAEFWNRIETEWSKNKNEATTKQEHRQKHK